LNWENAVNPDDAARQTWLRTLQTAPAETVAQAVAALGTLPAHARLRGPESGLVMVRGRADGTGEPFNLGEMTVTRASVSVSLDVRTVTGFGCIAGRDHRAAELVAVCDALLQHPAWHGRIRDAVLGPCEAAHAARRAERASRRAATRADFVTVVRSGES
jgi:alpha-D-ribose 1-methylphosphonate 5-triphosphate synthase subunit PhnG